MRCRQRRAWASASAPTGHTQDTVRQREGGQRPRQTGEATHHRGVGERGQGHGRQRDHLEMIDGGARPEEVLEMLELEKQGGDHHGELHPPHRGAGRGDQHRADAEDEQVADDADHGEVHRAGQPVADREQQAARHRAVLVADGEELGEAVLPGGGRLQLQEEIEDGLDLVPVGRVAHHQQRAHHVRDGQQCEGDEPGDDPPGGSGGGARKKGQSSGGSSGG